MRAHTIIVKTEVAANLPPFTGGRAANILVDRLRAEGSSGATHVGCSRHRIVNDRVALFEIYAPNVVSVNDILTAVNRAIAEYLHDLSPLQWETGIFSTVDCINQDL